MMNDARLGVGIQGLGLGESAYQAAVTYARDRNQGRSLTGIQYPEQAADPLMVHPDIRRMLLTMRAFTEGGRALAVWIGRNIDIRDRSDDSQARQEARPQHRLGAGAIVHDAERRGAARQERRGRLLANE